MKTQFDNYMNTFEKMKNVASNYSDAELRRHACVSRDNNHKCRDCFTCACWSVLTDRLDASKKQSEVQS